MYITPEISDVENNGRTIGPLFGNNWRGVNLRCGKKKLSTQVSEMKLFVDSHWSVHSDFTKESLLHLA